MRWTYVVRIGLTCNYLFSTALSVLGSLDDSGQVEELDLRTLIANDARHGRESREFILSNLKTTITRRRLDVRGVQRL